MLKSLGLPYMFQLMQLIYLRIKDAGELLVSHYTVFCPARFSVTHLESFSITLCSL